MFIIFDTYRIYTEWVREKDEESVHHENASFEKNYIEKKGKLWKWLGKGVVTEIF